MGSPDKAAAATKPPNPKVAAAPPPPDAPAMAAYPDWSAASMHAYYAAGVAPPAAASFFPHAAAWSGQMMTPYGTPIPYSPMYYPHPSMSACTAYVNPEGEKESGPGNKPKKATSGKSGDGGRGTSGSGYDDATHSGESGSEGSSETGEESAKPQDSAARRKRTSGTAFPEGETAEVGAQYVNTASKTSHGGRVSKLPVSAPGRAALPGPATNLNIGMDAWNAPSGSVKIGPNAASFTPGAPSREGAVPEHQWFQMDEGELKREKRKQSNRESARRSRLRKQQECEDLTKKVAELSGENNALKVELDKLKRHVEELQGENFSLMGCLRTKHPGLLTDEELAFVNGQAEVCASKGVNGSAPSTRLSIGDDSR